MDKVDWQLSGQIWLKGTSAQDVAEVGVQIYFSYLPVIR